MKTISIRVKVDDAVIDSGDVQKIIDPIWWTGDIYNSHEDFVNSTKSFSENERLVYAIQWYQAEVNNGGHDQFFYNYKSKKGRFLF